MADDIHVPDLSDALIATLDTLFPSRAPALDDPERVVWFKAGQADVVRYLVEQHRRQNETTYSE